jgi:coproporphyrinogen III oxidase-like Fe-S oxidoreductase
VEIIHGGEDAETAVEELLPETRLAERLAFGLRTNRGVERSSIRAYEGEIRAMIDAGLLTEQGARVATTRKGRLLVDAIGEVFF